MGNGTSAFTALTTSSGIFGAISDETGGTGVLVGSVSPALTGTMSFVNASGTSLTLTDKATLAYASTTGISGTNSTFTTATSTNLFAQAVTFGSNILKLVTDTITGLGVWDLGGATSFEVPNSSNCVVDAAGEVCSDTLNMAFAYATSTTGGVLPWYPPFKFTISSSTWTGTSTEMGYPTGVNFDEVIMSGICWANGTARIIMGNGVSTSSVGTISAGTSTINIGKRFNKNGTMVNVHVGTPTTLSQVKCNFDRVYLR